MATAAPIVPESLPFDNRSPTGAGCNHIPMNNSNHVPKINAAYSSNTSPLSTMTTNPAQSVTSPPPVTGKRARNSDESDVKAGHASTTEEDGRKKRSRGRPRLDTKDETAADRRRTQIRLAQRAYRHRKDTTITTLEQRVKELEKANDDMSKGFNDFYDILLSERALEAVPHAAQQLSAIANRISTVADKARNNPGEGSCSEDSDEHPVSNHGNHPNLQSAQATTSAVTAMPTNNGFHLDTSQQANIVGTSTGSPGVPGTASIEGTGGDAMAMRIGNQGTRSYGKPQEMTGQSMGPFSPEVQATRDERIDHKMRMMWPGFEGEFFDPDEVETYLRQLGIFIPQRAEYVEADVDLGDLDRDGSSARASCDSAMMPNGQQPGFATADSGYGGSSHSGTWTNSSNSPVSGSTDVSGPQVAVDVAQQPVMGLRGHDGGNEAAGDYDHGMANFILHSGPSQMWSQPMAWAVKSKIGLNVSLLIQEISSKSVCLGRSPGVRRRDVNKAVKVAAGLAAVPA
ncbi:hypothetical protein H633G_05237 [Metarhizium anisopliae BRIP 53284]|nr:hypothetical protein H633G_05237 [Metarhizium anisopliae BRIP 53284]